MTKKSYNTIYDRVQDVKTRMEEAAIRSGRSPEEVTLVGVTKTQSAESVRELIQSGVTMIGENRVQELLEKQPFLEDLPHETHLIGHLQRNKTKFLPGKIDMIQSLDDLKTVEALERIYGEYNETLDVLIEVNIGDETSKNGVRPREVLEFSRHIAASKVLVLRGLMAIPPFLEGDAVRPFFQHLYQLFIDIKAEKMDNGTVNTLSMGMSSDFEIAIEEGATMIRVGTSLFGPR